MKALASLAIVLLLASCASSGGLIDERLRDCESGGDISVLAGLDNLPIGEGVNEDRFDLMVEVSNNSSGELTVSFIRVEQQHPDMAAYRIENTSKTFNRVVEEGKDETFRLPLIGRRVISRSSSQPGMGGLELAVTVRLSNGDSYRCLFGRSVM